MLEYSMRFVPLGEEGYMLPSVWLPLCDDHSIGNNFMCLTPPVLPLVGHRSSRKPTVYMMGPYKYHVERYLLLSVWDMGANERTRLVLSNWTLTPPVIPQGGA